MISVERFDEIEKKMNQNFNKMTELENELDNLISSNDIKFIFTKNKQDKLLEEWTLLFNENDKLLLEVCS